MKILLAALFALLLAGCATDQAFIKAQAEAITAQSNARVAEAQAIAALAGKVDAGGASAYLIATAMAKVAQQPAQVHRPRDFLDYLNAFTGLAGTLGNIAVPILSTKENGRTARAGFERDIGMETARQEGETRRTQSVGGIAQAIIHAPRPPTTVITAGGDVLNGNGNTVDRRNCPVTAGNGAPSGAGGQGGGTTGPGGAAASGGSGGSAAGGC